MPRLDQDVKLDFRDVLLRPKRSTLKSRQDVDLHREFHFRNSKRIYRGIPVMASNMDTVGTFEMAKVLSQYDVFTCIHKHYSIEQWMAFIEEHKDSPKIFNCIAVSAGIGQNDLEKLESVLNLDPRLNSICLDVANGYTESFVQLVRDVRAKFPSHTIFAGNVATGEMVEELILSGADVVKVGIGPGSVCTTRKKAGVGYPQFSAVIECADAAHGLDGLIISDGGCTNPGDVAKAFGGGADFVMLGGIFAGHDQSAGDVIEKNGKKYKQFYGMASEMAMKKHYEKSVDYRAAEGKAVEIPYRGDVSNTIQDVLGGLRSACTYTGSVKLKELSKRATFVRVNQQTNESFAAFQTQG